MSDKKSPEKTIRILGYVAVTGAVLALIFSVLIIVNYLQVKRIDPLNSQSMKILTERLKANPGDEGLREEIRSLDLLARKAFFTSQWQIRTGGYLLLISLLIVVASLKGIDMIRKTIPDEPSKPKENFWEKQRRSRQWIAGTGILIILAALVAAFLTNHELNRDLENALASASPGADSREADMLKDSITGSVSGTNTADTALNRTDSATHDLILSGAISNEAGYPTQREINANFTSFRGPGGNGIDYHQNIPTSWEGKSGKNIRWKSLVPLPGFNSPIIWRDKVFLSGANESKREVYCFHAETGALVWTTIIEKIPGSPAKVPAVNKETGYAAPTMTTDGRRVYAIFANGDIAALNLEGKIVWAKNLGTPVNHYGHSSSLIMYRDAVIVQYDQRGSASVMALNGRTGETLWKTARNVKVSWASPVLVNTGTRMELLLAAEPSVISYDPGNGKERWRIDCIEGEVGPSLAYADGMVFSVNEYSKLAAVKIGNQPSVVWDNMDYLSDVPSPVATSQYVFLATSYGTVVCYDAKSGEKYWEHDFDQSIYSSPMLAEGRIYLIDKRGVAYIFTADKKFNLIGQPALGEGTFCTPAFADGRIFIRGNNHLYCIGK